MANVIIGYKNLVDEDNVLITHSTEVAGFEAENVQAPQLSSAFRTTVLNPGFVRATQPSFTAKVWQLVAALGCQVTAYASIISSNVDSANWTDTNASTSTYSQDIDPEGNRAIALSDDATAGEHYSVEVAAPVLDAEYGLVMSCWLRADTLTKARLHFDGDATGTITADFNLSTGALITSSGTADTSITQGSAPFTDWYLCAMSFAPSDSDTAWNVRLQCLDAAGASSYSGSTQNFDLGSPQLAYLRGSSDLVVPKFHSGETHGALARIQLEKTTDVEFMAFSLSGNETDRGSSDFYYFAPAPRSDEWVELEVYDSENANSQIDIGRLFVGPVWQSSIQTYTEERWAYPHKRRQLTLGITYIEKGEAYGEVMTLARELRVVESFQTALGGQIIAADATPVLVILDPDEGEYGQERMIYGYVTALDLNYESYIKTATYDGPAFGIQITIDEVLP